MSTIFGVHRTGEDIELHYNMIPETHWDEDNFIEVAKQSNSTIYWLNDLAKFLPDDLKVYPLDNTAQGIYTIGDIKKEISDDKTFGTFS